MASSNDNAPSGRNSSAGARKLPGISSAAPAPAARLTNGAVAQRHRPRIPHSKQIPRPRQFEAMRPSRIMASMSRSPDHGIMR